MKDKIREEENTFYPHGQGGAKTVLPRDLEDPQQTHTAEHGDAQRRHDFKLHQNGFCNSSTHHEAVESVEQGDEVGLQTQTVHLHQHLTGEHGQQHLVGHIWEKINNFFTTLVSNRSDFVDTWTVVFVPWTCVNHMG